MQPEMGNVRRDRPGHTWCGERGEWTSGLFAASLVLWWALSWAHHNTVSQVAAGEWLLALA